jgi:hypothetical protein
MGVNLKQVEADYNHYEDKSDALIAEGCTSFPQKT